jgi:hypothetical protein
MSRFAVLAIIVLIAVITVACAPKPKEVPQASAVDPAGQTVILKKATLAGTTKEDYFALYIMASKSDKEGAAQMLRDGKAFLLQPGTKVSVLKRHLVNLEIRVEDGKMGGKLGWVTTTIFQ